MRFVKSFGVMILAVVAFTAACGALIAVLGLIHPGLVVTGYLAWFWWLAHGALEAKAEAKEDKTKERTPGEGAGPCDCGTTTDMHQYCCEVWGNSPVTTLAPMRPKEAHEQG